ncbi:MAG: arsenate reductase (glutaredoxin) [Rhodospirillaceae bacterium]|jgi:arsenate reductase (glutaredoxin)|nr:arsenate reductase (glutaredoxin) [Rhodospirillaceae bacterium]MBT4426580.1 arsenate reductase (glutaredoxin) [Rhodospirillaceae bacterium]MBT5038075.1 arsenate reductase (glutaredoxin) [Rhodospirillaceae bacterium]
MTVTIYHNPRCSKSRQTLQLLRDNGVEPKIVEYLNAPPSAEEMKRILAMLGMAPRDLMRKKEAPYAARGLAEDSHSSEALIDAMRADPILIERPIVVKGAKAALGRPPENVLKLL